MRKILEVGIISLVLYLSFSLFRYCNAEENVNVISSAPRRMLSSSAVRVRFTVRNNNPTNLVGMVYRIEFFDREGQNIYPRGIGDNYYHNQARSVVSINPNEYQTVYSDWIANLPNVTSTKIIVLAFVTNENGRYKLTMVQ